MIFIEFLVKNFKPRYNGNGQQKIGVPIGFFPFWVKANTLRKFHENLWLGVSNDSRWLQRIGINISNMPIFFVEKMWEAFAVQKLLSFFQQKFQCICL